MMSVLEKKFYDCNTLELAEKLIGKILHSESNDGAVAGVIVETEAYLSLADLASHSRVGKTKRNAPMFAEPGLAYVYLIYGIHHCFNVTSGPVGLGEAILIRALEPISGIKLMQKRRSVTNQYLLCNGPGKICEAFNIDRTLNFNPLYEGKLTIRSSLTGDVSAAMISQTGRIGITKSLELPYRFTLENSPYLSRK